MRTIQYLSPTSISKFHESVTEFYLVYLAESRPPRIPQTQPMSIGSSFDAYAKSYLHEKVFGKSHDPKFEFTALFEAQVEPHNRDWSLDAGKYAFECYRASGALADLLIELGGAINTPRFELEVRGVIEGRREGVTLDVGPMTLLGKPDLSFLNRAGHHVILDWKVNGFCSQWGASPMSGYIRLREQVLQTWRNTGQHKSAIPMQHNGMLINAAGFLEHFDEDWARQLAIYSWLVGGDIGDDFVAAIDQLACKPSGSRWPHIRVAEHRLRVSADTQWKVFADAQRIWEIVHSDHIFRDLSREESIARCLMLEGTAGALKGEGSTNDKWFSNSCRGG